jgi:hypothetical protein
MKKFKMIMVSLVVLMSIVATSTVAFATNEDIAFSDVSKDTWYYEYVMEMNDAGIVCGNPDGTFSPDKPVSIGEYCTMICRALNAEVKPVEDGKHWASAYVKHIDYSGGWDTRIHVGNPDDEITRKEAVEVGLRMFGYRFPVEAKYLDNPFVDTNNLSRIAENYMVNAYYLGIISGNEKQEASGNDTITVAHSL